MLKFVLLLAVLAVASAQLISPYLSTGSYINPLYRNGLYSGYNLPYAYNYNYGYGLGLGYGYNGYNGYNYNLLYR